MILLSPPGDQDRRARYYITVSPNCFMPSSHVTRVYSGGDENAPRVCEFELVCYSIISSSSGIVTLPRMGIINVANSRLRLQGFLPIAISSLLIKPKLPKDIVSLSLFIIGHQQRTGLLITVNRVDGCGNYQMRRHSS